MIVYLDGVIGLNFMVDLMLLLGVNRLSGFPAGFGRAAAAAMVGGGYAGACLIPGFRFLASTFWRIVSLGIVTLLAFGASRSGFRRGVLFILLSMALGGLVLNFDTGNLSGLLICTLVLTLLCTTGFRPSDWSRKLVTVKLIYNGNEFNFLALVDTGNSLRDPITGEQVLVLSASLACQILKLPPDLLSDPIGLVCYGKGLRLIPYHGIGGNGMMAAMRCDQVFIEGRTAGNLVAFSPKVFPEKEYQALTGGYYG